MDKSLKICMIADSWSWPVRGGGEVYVWEMSKQLVNNYNCEVTIYAPNMGVISTKGKPIYKGIRIILVGPENLSVDNFVVRAITGVLISLRIFMNNFKEKYNLINSHGYPSAFTGKLASIFCRLPIIHTVHGCNLLDLGLKSPLYFIQKFLLTMIPFDLEITVSKNFMKYKNINKIIRYLPNGVDSKRFSYLSRKTKTTFTFLWVGRFDKIKGLDILIDAIKKLSVTKGNFELHLIGDGPIKEQISELVVKDNLSKYIKLGGNKFDDDLVEQYHNSDCFVLSSLSEGFPLTILEAMSTGLPIVSTKVGEIPNLVSENINGFLANPGDSESLFMAMNKSMEAKNLSNIGKNNSKIVEEKYSWKNVAKDLFSQYLSIRK